MSSLAARFSARMHKRPAQREITFGFEVSGEKHPKRSDPNKEAQKSPTVIVVDSPEQASDALLALKCALQDVSREACASLEDEVQIEEPHNADRVVRETPSEIAVGLSFSARLANAGPRKLSLPNWLMLGLYVLA